MLLRSVSVPPRHPSSSPRSARPRCSAPGPPVRRRRRGAPDGDLLPRGGRRCGLRPHVDDLPPQDRSSASAAPSFTGKQLAPRARVARASLSAHVDGPWFYGGGADVREPVGGDGGLPGRVDRARWIAAGPRFVFGPFTLLAGVRVARCWSTPATSSGQHRDGRPLLPARLPWPRRALRGGRRRAVAADALGAGRRRGGQDVLGAMLATTASVNVNVGWSAAALSRRGVAVVWPPCSRRQVTAGSPHAPARGAECRWVQ